MSQAVSTHADDIKSDASASALGSRELVESISEGRGVSNGLASSDGSPTVVVAESGPKEWVLEPGAFTTLPERPFQELWFELRTWSWKSLAVVPTVAGSSELDVAEKLIVVGVANTNRRMSLISAEGATVADTDRVIAMIRAAENRGDRVIVATDSIIDNPSAAPIIRAVNGALVSVRLGVSDRVQVERTVQSIGRSRVIGLVTRSS
jgi:hypothetical protein